MKSNTGRIRPYAPVLLEIVRLADASIFGLSMWFAMTWSGGEFTGPITLAILLSMAAFGMIAASLNCYRSFRVLPLKHELGRLVASWVLAMLPAAIIFSMTAGLHDKVLTRWFLTGLVYIVASRLLSRAILRFARISGLNYRTVAILGATPIGADLASEFSAAPWMGMRFAGFFDDRRVDGDRIQELGISGTIDDLVKRARSGQIDVIYIALPLRAELRIGELTRALADTTVTIQYVPDLSGFGPLHARFDLVGTIPTISIVDTPFRGRAALIKRVFDLFGASIGLVMISPILLVIATAIKINMPGPVFFRQPRYGLDGKTFQIWKFRTMKVMETGKEVAQATRNDSRITPLGKVLRRYSLDELPQLLNVIDGSMSMIGPRPHPINMNEEQRVLINRYMQRHIVKPGITGWAQVNGYRGETDTIEKVEKRIQFDLEYIERWSIWFDLKILWRTLRSVWTDPNAF
ncbi:MAG: undecaprenyl-phosphate glucose phosphotransferase [Burkholderiaceae bacterium]